MAIWRVAFKTPYAPVAPISSIPWANLTHVIHVGYQPQTSGAITDFTGGNQAALVSAAHASGVKILVDLSDATGGDFAGAVSGNQATLVTNLANVVNSFGYDGIDIDAEHSGTVAQMASLAGALRTALPSKLITICALINTYASWSAANVANIDRLNVLTYDMSGTFDPYSWFHSALYGPTPVTVNSMELTRTRFIGAGVPAAKINLGIPFYGYRSLGGSPVINGPRQSYTATLPTFTQMDYPTLLGNWDLSTPTVDLPSGGAPWIAISGGWVYWDTAAFIAAKVNYVINQGLGGFVCWSIEKDYISTGVTLAQKHPLLAATAVGASTPSLLVSPGDITNAAWQSAGTGCAKTNATTYTTVSAVCSLWQVVTVAANTTYVATITLNQTSGAPQPITFSISTTGFAQLCSAAFNLVLGTPHTFTCSVSSGANTQLQLEIDSGAATASSITISGASFQAVQAAAPTVDKPAGSYSGSVTVAITSATSGAAICYRTDGTDPTASAPGTCGAGSTTYGAPVTLSANATLKAIATKAGLATSDELTQAYTVTAAPPAGPIAVPPPYQTLALSAGVAVQIVSSGYLVYLLNTGPGKLYASATATPGANAQSILVPPGSFLPAPVGAKSSFWISADADGGVSLAAVPR
jgi:hypothetical protein